MPFAWRPVPGQVALIEVAGQDSCLTGVVVDGSDADDEPVVVDLGAQLLRVLSLSGLFITVALTYTGGLQGTGDTRSPLYISIISQIMVPLGICFVINETGTLDPIDIWVAILAGHAMRCALSVIRFRQGKWRGIVVDLGGTPRPRTP